MRAHSFAWSLPLLLSTVSFACGQQVGDSASGRRLAEASCMGCHGVTNAQPPASTFSAIAAMPSTSAQSLGVFLRTSHANMPNLVLSNSERDDVIAYILSLSGIRTNGIDWGFPNRLSSDSWFPPREGGGGDGAFR